jgi:hypothetical protein
VHGFGCSQRIYFVDEREWGSGAWGLPPITPHPTYYPLVGHIYLYSYIPIS